MGRLFRRLMAMVRSRRFGEDMDEELRFHVDMTRERLANEGMTPEEARHTATRRLPSPLLVREQSREAWGLGWLDRLLQDVRYAVRMMSRRPGFTATAITVLALGLGASTAVFSVVYSVLMRPLPFERPGELVALLEGLPHLHSSAAAGVSPPDYLAYRERQRSFTQIAAYKNATFELSGNGEPEQRVALRVAASLFSVLGRPPMLGRAFTQEEEEQGAPVVILSWTLWQRRYLADPAIIGRAVQLDRRPYTVVGIMPQGFEFPLRGPAHNAEPADLFVPLGFTTEQRTNYGSNFVFSVVARLKPGVTITAARGEATSLVTDLEALYPEEDRRGTSFAIAFRVEPLRREIVGGIAPLLWMLFAAVMLVLLVGCADLGGLLLTRAATRAGELNIRAALGAGRGRLIRQLMTESLVLAVAGALLGLGLASATIRAIASYAADYLPRAQEITLDWPVVSGMIAFALLSAVAFGLAPALWITSAHGTAIANRRATSGRGERRLLRTLVVVQVTLAIVLAIGAGLLVRSLNRLIAVDPGFRGAQAVAGTVAFPRATYADRRSVRDATERLLAGARALPGVRAAAIASTLPMHRDEVRPFITESMARAGNPHLPPTTVTWVVGSYFSTLGVPIRRGRAFADSDGLGDPVAIVNETFARQVWGQDDPIGRRIRWDVGSSPAENPWMTIVGVASDVKQGALSSETMPEVFEPLLQQSEQSAGSRDTWYRPRRLALIVRTDQHPESMIAAMHQAVHRVDPALPLTHAETLDTLVDASTTPQRFTTRLLGGFALAAVALAALGLYGLLSSFVSQRTREIGVRVALGAAPRDVVGLIVHQGVTLVVYGLLLGLAAALVASQAMRGFLFGIQPFDPLTFASVAIALAAVGLLASLLPAWRAARVDPVRALRAD